MNIDDMVTNYRNIGYSLIDARSKVCQDIILLKISKSHFKNHITIKGGVVMHSISNSIRRVTEDLDLDFIKYSLDDNSIRKFINKLNTVKDNVTISIQNSIEKLHHQDYSGKRVNIIITDNYGNKLENKLDIGVHKNFDIKQDEYFFNLDSINESICLLINSKEQIFTEKLKSLLKFGFRSTRYKDLYDFYYLITETNLNKDELLKTFNLLIFKDETIKEKDLVDIISRLNSIFNSKIYLRNLDNPKYNWVDISTEKVISTILSYFTELVSIFA